MMHILLLGLVIILLLVISPTLRKLGLGTAGVFVVAASAVFIVLPMDSSARSISWLIGIFMVAILVMVILLIAGGINLLRVVFGSGAEYVHQRGEGKKHEEALKSAGGKALELLAEDAIDEDRKNSSPVSYNTIRQRDRAESPVTPHVQHDFPASCCVKCRSEVIILVSITSDLLVLDQLKYPWAVHSCAHHGQVQEGSIKAQIDSWTPFEVHGYSRNVLRGRVGQEEPVSLKLLDEHHGPWSRYWNGEPVFAGVLPHGCYRIVTLCNLAGELIQPDIIARYIPE